MKRFLGVLLIVTACCSQGERETIRDAQTQATKLRKHFMGYVPSDVSTLVAETQSVASRLKLFKFNKLANKFYSYLDVLMYGNNTLDESVRDTQELVTNGVCSCDYKRCIELLFFK